MALAPLLAAAMAAALCQPSFFLLASQIEALPDSCGRCVWVLLSQLALDLASHLPVAARMPAAMGLVCRCPSLAAVVARVPTALGSVCRWVSVAARVLAVAARVAAAMGSVCKWLFLLVPQPALARVL